VFEWAIAICSNGQQTLTIFGGRKDTDGLSHANRLAHLPEFVNHQSVSVHSFPPLQRPEGSGGVSRDAMGADPFDGIVYTLRSNQDRLTRIMHGRLANVA
jgi:hypothetical protein